MNNEYMTATEASDLNKAIWKRALKRTAIITTVIVAANVAVHIVEKKL